ncbi:unnamed protein product [Schistosoma mansoni]|uniref:Smp_205330 n=1 Tax=Schistosoma mansoni TaxID=6183 RepID=UPI00022C82AA|nr:unnamed protein product [Schistosoma mansoni]|eukprot:XP_018644701.1 unnamed protein product [Schistosoma mansoni]
MEHDYANQHRRPTRNLSNHQSHSHYTHTYVNKQQVDWLRVLTCITHTRTSQHTQHTQPEQRKHNREHHSSP